MLLPAHNYKKPPDLANCLTELGGGSASNQIVAGGTDVIVNMRLKLFKPDNVISIRQITELQNVEQLPDGGLRIGAGCRLSDLERDASINERFPALAESIRSVASTHIRNMATLGGNICLQTRCWYTNNSEQWRQGKTACFKTAGDMCHVIKSSGKKCHAINNADTPLALIALGATLKIQSAEQTRDVPIAEFFNDDGIDFMNLAPNEILTHVTIPACDDRTVFLKFAARKGIDFSIGSIAARYQGTNQQAEDLIMVLGSLSTSPRILTKATQIIRQDGLTDDAIERAADVARDDLGEVTSLYSRAVYKKQIARVLVKRALIALRGN